MRRLLRRKAGVFFAVRAGVRKRSGIFYPIMCRQFENRAYKICFFDAVLLKYNKRRRAEARNTFPKVRSYMKHKKLFITFIVFFSIIVVLATFLMIWFWGDSYEDFKDFRQELEIPGLNDGAVPQGIANYSADYTYTDEDGNKKTVKQEYIFISAYMKSGPSRIYVTGKESGYIGYVTMSEPDGKTYSGHCGGIAINGDTLWVTSEDTVFVAKRSSNRYTNIAAEIIAKAPDKGSVKFTASFNANCNASFCFYYDAPSSSSDKLYVGEFYRPGDYETSSTHHVTAPDGNINRAFMYEYSVNNGSSNTYGLNTLADTGINVSVPKIDKIYSMPDEIQGFARTSAGAVLSQSWGLANSNIYYYDWEAIADTSSSYKSLTGSNFKYEGVSKNGIPYTATTMNVYFIDDTKLWRSYSIPSMSEGLCTIGDRVYVLFESASYKYKLFVRQQLENIYSFIPRKR